MVRKKKEVIVDLEEQNQAQDVVMIPEEVFEALIELTIDSEVLPQQDDVEPNLEVEAVALDESDSTEKVECEAPQLIEKKKKKKDLLKETKFCKIVKKELHRKHFDAYVELIDNPQWVCKKCGRAAASAKSLCKPAAMHK